jgi:hypothetical protein
MSPGVLKHIYEPGSAAYRTKADNRTSPCPTELPCVATNHNCPERQRKLGAAAVSRIRNRQPHSYSTIKFPLLGGEGLSARCLKHA